MGPIWQPLAEPTPRYHARGLLLQMHRLVCRCPCEEVRRLCRQLSHESRHEVEMKSMFFKLVMIIMSRITAGKRYYGDEKDPVGAEEAKKFQEIVDETFLLRGASPVSALKKPLILFLALNVFFLKSHSPISLQNSSLFYGRKETFEIQCSGSPNSYLMLGKQDLRHLLIQFGIERKMQLASLRERHSVSQFLHRLRIQYLLQLRILSQQVVVQDGVNPAASSVELDQVQRGGSIFLPRENREYQQDTTRVCEAEALSPTNEELQEVMSQNSDGGWSERSVSIDNLDWQENVNHFANLETWDIWRDVTSVSDEWLENNSDNAELRKILERRSVSTTLASDFRERMEQMWREFEAEARRDSRTISRSSRIRSAVSTPTNATNADNGSFMEEPYVRLTEERLMDWESELITPSEPPSPSWVLLEMGENGRGRVTIRRYCMTRLI